MFLLLCHKKLEHKMKYIISLKIQQGDKKMVIIAGMGTVLATKAKFQNGHSKINIYKFDVILTVHRR